MYMDPYVHGAYVGKFVEQREPVLFSIAAVHDCIH
jgi:hypothetical protein